MPVTAATAMMTVEEFRRLPESSAHDAELQRGEVVRMTRPRKRHDSCARRIHRGLILDAEKIGVIDREFPYRPLADHEVRVADLAWVTQAHWDETDPDDNVHGSPEFVVEVVSPSNSAEELQERKQLCLSTGCQEYWSVYPKLLQVEVATPAGARVYSISDVIEVVSMPGLRLPVRDIFEP